MSLTETLNSAVVAAIVGALTGAIASGIVARIVANKTLKQKEKERQEERMESELTETYRALLFGREIVFWINQKAAGNEDEFVRRTQGLRDYLNQFGLIEVNPPLDPTSGGGVAAQEFVQNVVGRFEARNRRFAAAILLAWNGLIPQLRNNPERPIDIFAETAGLPLRLDGESDVEYLQRLTNLAEERLTG